MDCITSAKNPIVRRFRDVATGRAPELLLADGVRPIEEAIAAGLAITEVVVSPRLDSSERGGGLRAGLLAAGVRLVACSDAVLGKISSLDTHQGVAALVARPRWQPRDLRGRDNALIVLAAGVRDPGNLGALVRTAEAAGATGVVALAGGADPFREKAVRASAGSVYRIPVMTAQDPAAIADWLSEDGIQLVVAESGAGGDYLDVDYAGPTAIAVGAEVAGVPEPLRTAAAVRAGIPMAGRVESLNVAVAAGILLYEARRQRR